MSYFSTPSRAASRVFPVFAIMLNARLLPQKSSVSLASRDPREPEFRLGVLRSRNEKPRQAALERWARSSEANLMSDDDKPNVIPFAEHAISKGGKLVSQGPD